MKDKLVTAGVYVGFVIGLIVVLFVLWRIAPGLFNGPGALTMWQKDNTFNACVAEHKFTRDECIRLASGTH